MIGGGFEIPKQEIVLDPNKTEQSGSIIIPITDEMADQFETEGVPEISNLKELLQTSTSTKGVHYINSPKHPLSTSTNKDRKAKKAKRQNRKKGRR